MNECKPLVVGGQAGQHVAHLGGVGSAVKMLSSRVEVLLHYLQDVQTGRAPPDHAVLRAAASLAGRLHPGLTLVHVRAQLEQPQHTFMS